MNCPECQAEILEILETNGACPACGARLRGAVGPSPARVSPIAGASLLVGILALCALCFPPLQFLLGLSSIGLGLQSIISIRDSRGQVEGKGLALIGMALGTIAAVIACILFAVIKD